MTSERRRAIIVVIATLVAGILIGALGQAMLAKNYYRFGDRGRSEKRGAPDDRSKKRFMERVYKVSDATEAQKAAIEPILEHSMNRFDSLRNGFEGSAKANLEKLFMDLEGELTPQQIQQLKEHFERRGKPDGRK
jgi:hypothetical protein